MGAGLQMNAVSRGWNHGFPVWGLPRGPRPLWESLPRFWHWLPLLFGSSFLMTPPERAKGWQVPPAKGFGLHCCSPGKPYWMYGIHILTYCTCTSGNLSSKCNGYWVLVMVSVNPLIPHDRLSDEKIFLLEHISPTFTSATYSGQWWNYHVQHGNATRDSSFHRHLLPATVCHDAPLTVPSSFWKSSVWHALLLASVISRCVEA